MPRLGILRARDASRERQAEECAAPAVKPPRATRKKTAKRARRR